jgi:hypothetical protein
MRRNRELHFRTSGGAAHQVKPGSYAISNSIAEGRAGFDSLNNLTHYF